MPLDLIIVLVTGFAIFFIGSVIYYHDEKSVTNLIFFLISLTTLLWSVVNYFSLNTDSSQVLFWVRLVLFFATPHSVMLFLFINNFPSRRIVMPKKIFYTIIGVTVLAMGSTLTPFVFNEVIISNQQITPIPGFLMPFFIFVVIGSLLASVFLATKKYIRAKSSEKKQWLSVFLGILISYILLIFTNFVLVIIFANTTFNVYGPLFMLPAIVGIAYAILKHHLMNVKVIGTEILVFILLSIGLIEIFLSSGALEISLRIFGFIALFIFSIFLIRSVLNEVRQREKVEKLVAELEAANTKLKKLDEAKTEFLSITSHQLRTPLSSIKGYLSMILDGDFGKFKKEQGEALDRVYSEVERLIRLVQVFLNVSRIESGRLKIAQVEFNMSELIDNVVDQLRYIAEDKGLEIEYKKISKNLLYVGDPDKLKDVIVNLVDNAIKYTQKGKVWVEAGANKKNLVVEVHDTGVGIEKDYAANLFEKFSRAKGIAQIDAGGTGLGLFIVKKIVEVHHGTIRAESDGPGKGTTFILTLPLDKPVASEEIEADGQDNNKNKSQEDVKNS